MRNCVWLASLPAGRLVVVVLRVLSLLDASCLGLSIQSISGHGWFSCAYLGQVLLLSVYHTVISIQNLTTNEHVGGLQDDTSHVARVLMPSCDAPILAVFKISNNIVETKASHVVQSLR